MVARRKAQQTEEETVIEPDEQEMVQPGTDEQDADSLDGLLAELGGGADVVVAVSKVNKQGNREVVGRFHPTDLDLIVIRNKYGGGEYWLTGRRGNKIAKGFPKRVFLAEPINQGNELAAASNDRLAQMMESIARQQADQMQRFMDMMITMNKPADSESVKHNLLRDMQLMKEIMGGNQRDSMSTKEMLELFSTGLELGKEINSGGGDTGMMDVLLKGMEQFGKPLGMAIEHQLKQQQTRPAAPGQRQVTHQAQPVAETTIDQGQTTQDGMNFTEQNEAEKMFRFYVGVLVQNAQQQSNPELWAELILDKAQPADIRKIIEAGAIQYLGNIDNRVFDYQDWFHALEGELVHLLDQESETGNVSGSDSETTDETGVENHSDLS